MIRKSVLLTGLFAGALILLPARTLLAQTGPSSPGSAAPQPAADAGASTDFFLMPGSDFDRPGLVPRANLNIGIGHTFGFLKKDPIGDEVTFTYTYENAGSHGFFHTNFGSHTEALGIMKNFNLPKTKVVTGYTWVQAGLTSFTGYAHVENRFYEGRPSRGTPPPASATPGVGSAAHRSPHRRVRSQNCSAHFCLANRNSASRAAQQKSKLSIFIHPRCISS